MSPQQRDNSAIKDSCVISGNIFSLQLSFLWQTAASGCEGFPTFRELSSSPFSGCTGGLVAPKLWCYQTTRTPWKKNWWFISFGATKPPAHSEDKTNDSSVLVLPNHQHNLKKNRWLISFGAIKPPAHPEYGDGVSCRNVVRPSHSDASVCQRKFHRILSPRKFQDLFFICYLLNDADSGTNDVTSKR